MYVCMHTCMYVSMHVSMYLCLHACVYIYTYARLFELMRANVTCHISPVSESIKKSRTEIWSSRDLVFGALGLFTD